MSMKTLHTYNSRMEAEMAKSFLEANNIKTHIFADDQGGLTPHMAFAIGVDLKVHEDDFHKAKALLDSLNE